MRVLITQLMNQDPFDAMDNQEVLEQISQIRSLESSMTLVDTLSDMMAQERLSAGSATART